MQAIVAAKATAEETAAFGQWLVVTAQAAADAAKDGGFMGFGAKQVSDGEQAMLDRCAPPSQPADVGGSRTMLRARRPSASPKPSGASTGAATPVPVAGASGAVAFPWTTTRWVRLSCRIATPSTLSGAAAPASAYRLGSCCPSSPTSSHRSWGSSSNSRRSWVRLWSWPDRNHPSGVGPQSVSSSGPSG